MANGVVHWVAGLCPIASSLAMSKLVGLAMRATCALAVFFFAATAATQRRTNDAFAPVLQVADTLCNP